MNNIEDKMRISLEICSLAADSFEYQYHAPSKLHIYWIPWMVPFGASASHTFSDQAYKNMLREVVEMVHNASERDLRLWLSEYEEYKIIAQELGK